MFKQLIVDKAKDQMFSTILLLVATSFLFYKNEKSDNEQKAQIMKLETRIATLSVELETARKERDDMMIRYYELKGAIDFEKKLPQRNGK